MNIINRKGFTLIELLAVIVILALLVLVAMPNVTSLMSQAQQNTFITEAEEMAKSAETAYTMKQMSASYAGYINKTSNTTYIYYCVKAADLVTNGLVSKTGTVEGKFELWIPKQSGEGKTNATRITYKNDSFEISNALLDKLAAGDTTTISSIVTSGSGEISSTCTESYQEHP